MPDCRNPDGFLLRTYIYLDLVGNSIMANESDRILAGTVDMSSYHLILKLLDHPHWLTCEVGGLCLPRCGWSDSASRPGYAGEQVYKVLYRICFESRVIDLRGRGSHLRSSYTSSEYISSKSNNQIERGRIECSPTRFSSSDLMLKGCSINPRPRYSRRRAIANWFIESVPQFRVVQR